MATSVKGPVMAADLIWTIVIWHLFKFEIPALKSEKIWLFIPPPNEVGGGVYWIHLVRLSVDDMVSGA